jgi:hypothetical protein
MGDVAYAVGPDAGGNSLQENDGNELEWIAKVHENIQKMRIQVQNRLTAAEQGRSTPAPAVMIEIVQQFELMEKQLIKTAKGYLKYHPAWPWLKQVRGLGEGLGMKLLGLIGDVSRFETESKLFRFAGLAVIDGQAERPRKGEKIHYNKRLKTTLYLIGECFIKSNSPYRRIYDEAKAYYAANRDWTKMHVHLAAMRVMEKIFLSHLYLVWRQELGLHTRLPWVCMYGGHLDRYWPWEFVPDFDYRWQAEVLREWREMVAACQAAQRSAI